MWCLQGSVVGLLFLIFINDLGNIDRDNICPQLFADDTNVFVHSKNTIDLQQKCQDAINKISSWLIVGFRTFHHRTVHHRTIHHRTIHHSDGSSLDDSSCGRFITGQFIMRTIHHADGSSQDGSSSDRSSCGRFIMRAVHHRTVHHEHVS